MSHVRPASVGRHFLRFNAAGALGILIQLACLHLLVGLGLHYVVATALAVVAAVIHNFFWHWKWTWADRGLPASRAAVAFSHFAIGNGVVSMVGNVLAMPLLVGRVGLGLTTANLMAITACGLANFWIADRLAFRPVSPPTAPAALL
jgi:putative flippase GtrA